MLTLHTIQIGSIAVEPHGTRWKAFGDGITVVNDSPMLAMLEYDAFFHEEAIADAEQLVEAAQGRQRQAMTAYREAKNDRENIHEQNIENIYAGEVLES